MAAYLWIKAASHRILTSIFSLAFCGNELVSSESDYWGLISTLEKARFLVMVEYNKFGLTRANLTEAEQKQFYNKYIKPMHLKIEENGDVTILLRD